MNKEVSTRLAAVQTTFRELDTLIGDVEKMMGRQLEGVGSITTAIAYIDANAQSGSARSQEIAATAQTLREQADQVSAAMGWLSRLIRTKTDGLADGKIPAKGSSKSKLSLAA